MWRFLWVGLALGGVRRLRGLVIQVFVGPNNLLSLLYKLLRLVFQLLLNYLYRFQYVENIMKKLEIIFVVDIFYVYLGFGLSLPPILKPNHKYLWHEQGCSFPEMALSVDLAFWAVADFVELVLFELVFY